MNHSSWILQELTDPSPLNRLLMEQFLMEAAKEAGKTLDSYLDHIKSEMKFEFVSKIQVRFQQGGIMFYILRRV